MAKRKELPTPGVKLLVRAVTRKEGGKRSMNVAQVTEVIGIVSELFCQLESADLMLLMSHMCMNGQRRMRAREAATRR